MLILILKMATIHECLVNPRAELTQSMRRGLHTIRSINRSFAELNRFGDVSGIDFQALISGIIEKSCKALKSGIHAMLNRIV